MEWFDRVSRMVGLSFESNLDLQFNIGTIKLSACGPVHDDTAAGSQARECPDRPKGFPLSLWRVWTLTDDVTVPLSPEESCHCLIEVGKRGFVGV
jgi:hypothetical protein